MKEAAELAESTQILMNVSEFTDVSQATDTLISAVQAFGYTADTSMEVVDLLNTIGNNYAISTADLAQSLTKSSASLVAAGGDLAEAAALTATANAIIQDADSVGTALKTTSLRLRGTDVKVLEEEGLDSEGAVTSKSKLQSKVKALSGVDILTATGEYKSTYEILSDIADVWESMNDMDQAALLELISGKRNSSVIAAILQNPQELKDAYEDAMDAEGSALKENEKYLDSIQGKIDQFNNAMQSMWSDTLDSDWVKSIVEAGTSLIKIIDNVGLLQTALFGLFTYLSNKKNGSFDLASILGIHDKGKGWTIGQEGFTGWVKEVPGKINGKFKKKSIVEDVVGNPEDINIDAKEYAEAISDNINDYVKVDTSQIDTQIEDIRNKLMIARNQLDDAKSADWDYYKSLGSYAPAKDRDNRIAEKQNEISSLEAQLTTLQAKRSETMSDAALKYADANINGIKAETQAQRSLFEAIDRVRNVKLSMGNEQDAALKIDQINQAASQGQVALSQYAATLGDSDMALQAYIASLNGEKASLAGFNQFIQTHNAGIKASGIAAKAAAVGHAALNAAISMGLSFLIQFGIEAIMKLVQLFKDWISPTQKLTEELNDLKKELQDIQSEIETVSSELETMEDRMAELLAKDSLSFVEQEELDRLQKENNELQRRLDLLEQEEKIKAKEAGETFVKTMESYEGTSYTVSGEANFWDRLVGNDIYNSNEKFFDSMIAEYLSTENKHIKELDRKAIQTELDKLTSAAEGVEYFTGDDLTDEQKEVNEWLDYVYNLQDRWAISQNGKNAKTNAISRIFDKDENNAIHDSIDEYVEALSKGDTSAKSSIENIIKNNEALVEDLEASGLSVRDAVEYFTAFASDANYATIEGKVKEIEEATKRLNSALGGVDTSSIDTIKQALTDKGWVDADGKLISTVIAEYFGGEEGGISSETQAEIERLVKQIYDGKISVENALKQFEYFGIESTMEIYISEVKTNFKNVFVELEDADGLIDTFEELGEAIGSTADALKTFNKAEAETANSGRVSIETALQLMEYTDDYGSVLEVVDGKLQLVDGAEDALIQTRINAIKTSAEASLADAQAAHQKAQDAVATYRAALTTDMSAEVVAKSWEKVLAAGAGLLAGIKSLLTDETWTEAYNRVYNETLSNITGYETTYDDAGLQALVDAEADAEKAVKSAQDRVNLANELTSETLESINDADGFDDPDDVKDDRFQKEMDYWENRIGANQAKYEQIQNEIDLMESKGQKANAAYYREQITLENQRMHLLQGQKRAAKEYLATLDEGSEEWWEAANTLNDIEGEIDGVTASIVDLQDAIGEISVYKFDEYNTRLDNITGKLGTIRDLIAPNGEEDWFDDEGNWTEAGVAVLGSHIQELETYKQGYQKTVDEMAKYAEGYEGNENYYEALGIHSEQEYYDKVESLTDQQYDYAKSISDTEQSVVDMYESSIDAVEEYVDTLIDGYNDYIDSVKEALSAERD